MLNAEDTQGAVVAGYSFDITDKSYDDVQALIDAALALGAEVFVAGDTSDGSGEENFMAGAVVGYSIAIVDVDGDPVEVTRAAIDEALAKAKALDISSLGDLADLSEVNTFLLSWGPLPAAALSFGARHEAAYNDDINLYTKPTDVKYKFHSMQNMSQEWGAEGTDGVTIASCEFSDVFDVDISADALAAKVSEVPLITEPKLFLTARYD